MKPAIARFARNLGTMIRSGVPILQALDIVADTTGNWTITKAVRDVQDSVRRPGVPRVGREGGPAVTLGRPVVAALLQAEGVHPEHMAGSRPTLRPGREHPGGDVAQVHLIPEGEVEVLSDLEREQVAAVAEQGPLQVPGRSLEVTAGPGPGGGQMGPLTRCRRFRRAVQDVTG